MERKKQQKRYEKPKMYIPQRVHKRRIPPPTKHLPGTKAKIEVLRLRYISGFELWNEQDARN